MLIRHDTYRAYFACETEPVIQQFENGIPPEDYVRPERVKVEGELRISDPDLESFLSILRFNNLDSLTFIKEPR